MSKKLVLMMSLVNSLVIKPGNEFVRFLSLILIIKWDFFT